MQKLRLKPRQLNSVQSAVPVAAAKHYEDWHSLMRQTARLRLHLTGAGQVSGNRKQAALEPHGKWMEGEEGDCDLGDTYKEWGQWMSLQTAYREF